MNNQNAKEKAWCRTHPVGYIGKDQFGNWYETCVWGHKEKIAGRIPTCEIIVERGEENGR